MTKIEPQGVQKSSKNDASGLHLGSNNGAKMALGGLWVANFDRCQQHLRGNLLLHLRGAWAEPRRTAQRRSKKKLSNKAFRKVCQAICRPDVQSTCPTSCSSRPATVERSIIIIMIIPSPLGALRGGGVSQGLGRSSRFGANLMGFARKAEEA